VSSSARRSATAVERLDEVTRRLRRECPWDREQDERSIVPHTVEEAYELADAAGRRDDARMLDELGDVLFQVHFLSLLLEQRGAGDLAAVADHCRKKLIRRHPHVFGEAEAEGTAQVLRNWDRIKQEEEGRGGAAEPFADVPENLPALLYARKLQRRAATAENPEAEDQDPAGPVASITEARSALDELDSLVREGESGRPTADPAGRDAVERGLGEALFATVNLARQLGADPELALRAAAERFRESKESSSS
jgi:MazG family protein